MRPLVAIPRWLQKHTQREKPGSQQMILPARWREPMSRSSSLNSHSSVLDNMQPAPRLQKGLCSLGDGGSCTTAAQIPWWVLRCVQPPATFFGESG